MPYTYEDKSLGGPFVTDRATVDSRRVLEEQFAQAFEENPIMAVSRWAALERDKQLGPKLSKEEALNRLNLAGMPGALTFDDNGISEEALKTLISRKRVELRRRQIFDQSRGGAAEAVGRFGVALGTTMVDPVNVGLAFVPIVGQARYLKALEASKSAIGRFGVRARVGAIEGVAGAAAVEPLIYGSRKAEQYDYDAVDSLMNVSFGAIFGGALHGTVGGIADLFPRTAASTPSLEAGPKDLLKRTAEARVEPTIGPDVPAVGTTAPIKPMDTDALTNQLLSVESMRKLVDEDHQKNRRIIIGEEEKAELADLGVDVKDGKPIFEAKSPEEVSNVREAVGQAVLDEPIDVVSERAAWRQKVEKELRGDQDASDWGIQNGLKMYDDMVEEGTAPADAAFHVVGDTVSGDIPIPESVARAREELDNLPEKGQVDILPGTSRHELTLETQNKRVDESWTKWAQRQAEQHDRSSEDYEDVIQEIMKADDIDERAAALQLLFEEEILPTKQDLQAFGTKAYEASDAEIAPLVEAYREALRSPRPELRIVEGTKQPDPEVQQALDQAEVTLKEVPEDPAEAIDDDLALAESDLKETEKQLAPDEKEPDPDIAEMEEATTTAERWAKASEIAVTCLTRK